MCVFAACCWPWSCGVVGGCWLWCVWPCCSVAFESAPASTPLVAFDLAWTSVLLPVCWWVHRIESLGATTWGNLLGGSLQPLLLGVPVVFVVWYCTCYLLHSWSCKKKSDHPSRRSLNASPTLSSLGDAMAIHTCEEILRCTVVLTTSSYRPIQKDADQHILPSYVHSEQWISTENRLQLHCCCLQVCLTLLQQEQTISPFQITPHKILWRATFVITMDRYNLLQQEQTTSPFRITPHKILWRATFVIPMDRSNFVMSLPLRILALHYLEMDIPLVVTKTQTSFYYPTMVSSWAQEIQKTFITTTRMKPVQTLESQLEISTWSMSYHHIHKCLIRVLFSLNSLVRKKRIYTLNCYDFIMSLGLKNTTNNNLIQALTTFSAFSWMVKTLLHCLMSIMKWSVSQSTL